MTFCGYCGARMWTDEFEFCATCRERKLAYAENLPRFGRCMPGWRRPANGDSHSGEDDPAFEDVVRALEDDR